jgi:hypothetical protein
VHALSTAEDVLKAEIAVAVLSQNCKVTPALGTRTVPALLKEEHMPYAALQTDFSTVLIFKGRTPFKAANKAKDWVFTNSVYSRDSYEKEHGPVSDEKWLKEMKTVGYEIFPAKRTKNK